MNKKEADKINCLDRKVAILKTDQKHIRTDVKDLRTDVKEILENHLPHIKEELAVNKVKIALVTGAAAFLATFIATRLLEAL